MTKKLFEQFARIFALALHDNFKKHLDFIDAVNTNGNIVEFKLQEMDFSDSVSEIAVPNVSRTSLKALDSSVNWIFKEINNCFENSNKLYSKNRFYLMVYNLQIDFLREDFPEQTNTKFYSIANDTSTRILKRLIKVTEKRNEYSIAYKKETGVKVGSKPITTQTLTSWDGLGEIVIETR
tara:strand:+ start:457 stop:996 length:540 start_codon:yes stop_codon:yes gene_type:complete